MRREFVQYLGVPVRVLANVDMGEMDAEADSPAQGVEQGPVGDAIHARGDERVVAQPQRRHQFVVVEDDKGSRRPARLRPPHRRVESVAKFGQHGPVRLGRTVGVLDDGLVAGCHGQRRTQTRHIAREQLGGHPACQEEHFPGHVGGHAGVAVAVSPHPRCECEGHDLDGQRRAIATVQFAHRRRNGFP